MRSQVGAAPGLELDHACLGLLPRRIGLGDALAARPGRLGGRDRTVERAPRHPQCLGVLGGQPGQSFGLQPLVLDPLPLGSRLRVRRCDRRREPCERIELRLDDLLALAGRHRRHARRTTGGRLAPAG